MGWAPAAASVPTGPGDRFVALNPARVVNTQVTAGKDVTVGLLGRGGLPTSNVDAIVANVQVDHPSRAGYLRVTPGGNTSQTAVQEFSAGQPMSNMVTVRLGANGTITLHLSAGTARVYVDLTGYYQPAAVAGGATYHPVSTARIYGTGAPALNASQGYRAIPVLGRGGIPSSGVSAIVANVEVNSPTAGGYVRITPAGVTSATSSQEYLAQQTISAAVTVKLGAGGAIWALLSRGSAHVYVDVLGWYGASGDTSGASFHPVNTDRSYGVGAPVLSSAYDRDIAVAGTSSVPLSGAVAVVANVEASRPWGTGYLRVTPGGVVTQTATQHYAGGHDVSNLAIVKLNQGMIKLHLSERRCVRLRGRLRLLRLTLPICPAYDEPQCRPGLVDRADLVVDQAGLEADGAHDVLIEIAVQPRRPAGGALGPAHPQAARLVHAIGEGREAAVQLARGRREQQQDVVRLTPGSPIDRHLRRHVEREFVGRLCQQNAVAVLDPELAGERRSGVTRGCRHGGDHARRIEPVQ